MFLEGAVRDNRIKADDFGAGIARFTKKRKERFWELDFLRGLCVVLMVFDHFMFNMMDVLPVVNEFFGTTLGRELSKYALVYWKGDFRNTVRFFVICTLFVLCGISCTLSKSNFKRGFLLALCALGITGVTGVIESYYEGFIVRFGVLHMLAAAVLMYAVLDLLARLALLPVKGAKAKKIAETALGYLPALTGFVLLCVYLTCYGTFSCKEGYPFFYSTVMPSSDKNQSAVWAIFVYVKHYQFDSADYFPILPWATMVLLGSAIGRAVYHTPAKYAFRPLDGSWNNGVCFLGRHTAIIYLSHMVVIPVITILAVALYSLFV